MLKPKKRKDRVYLMRSMKDGYVIRSNAKRVVLTKEATDGILLVYDPNYDYPSANRVVRLVLDMVYRNKQKCAMKNEFSWETFVPCMEKKYFPTREATKDLEIKGVQLRNKKFTAIEVSDMIKAFGDIAEQELIERFKSGVRPTEEQYEEMQRIGHLMLQRALEKEKH